MASENSNGVELTKAVSKHEEVGQAPKAKCESVHSLDGSTVDLESGAKGGKGDDAAVKYVKNAGDAAVDIGGATQVAFAGMGKDELMKYANDPFWVRLRWALFVLFWLAWLAMLVGAIIIVVLAPKCPAPAPLEYWQKGVVYSVNVKSFQDSNGDGKGDLKGLVERLDHFVHLGVNMIALSPIYPASMTKYGHDVEDFTGVHPDFGTLEDFKALTSAAKAKDLKVVMDFVPNHSSKKHSWFTESAKNDPAYKDYYIWKDAPNNWSSVFGGLAWTFDETRKQYYYHKYSSDQPDLNLRNQKVREEISQALRFWLDQGSSGFRLLSVPYLFEEEDVTLDDNAYQIRTKNLNETYMFVAEMRKLVQEYEGADGEHRVLLVEAEDSDTESVIKYYGSESDPLADLPINAHLIKDISEGFTGQNLYNAVYNYISVMPGSWAWPTWVLGNADVRRTASRLGTSLIDGLTMVQLLLPGTPISYYGEEIGMEDVNPIPGGCAMNPLTPEYTCNQARSPYQWDNSTYAGFSESVPWFDVGQNLATINARTQMGDDGSHSSIFRAVLALRSLPAIQYGDTAFPVVNSTNIFAFTRIRKGAPGYLVMLNTNKNTEEVVDLSAESSLSPEAQIVIRTGSSTLKEKVTISEGITIGPHEGLVLSFVPKF